MKDYYALLGLEASATKRDVKKNYRKLVTKFHPDKNSAADAASKFIVINEAYEVLSDAKRRAHYDLKRWEVSRRKHAIEQNFTVVKAPQESLRTRRRKAQQKRGLAFQQAKSSRQWFSLLKESFFVSARYIFHFFGIILLLLIFYSAITQISDAFAISTFVGVGICVFLVALLYWTVKLVENLLYNLKLDIETFSILYGEAHRTAIFFTVSALGIILLIILIGVIKIVR